MFGINGQNRDVFILNQTKNHQLTSLQERWGRKIRYKLEVTNDKIKHIKYIRRYRQWQVGVRQGWWEKFSTKRREGFAVQADGNSWKGNTKHITIHYQPTHVRSPDWAGLGWATTCSYLHTADKQREMPWNKMTLWFHFLVTMFVFSKAYCFHIYRKLITWQIIAKALFRPDLFCYLRPRKGLSESPLYNFTTTHDTAAKIIHRIVNSSFPTTRHNLIDTTT